MYGKLRGVGAAVCADDEQTELVDQARGLMNDICNDHVSAAQTFIKDPALRDTLIQTVKDECQELVEYIVAAKRFNLEINSRAKDRVISFGEKLSCRFMAALLQDVVSVIPSLLHQLSACSFAPSSYLNSLLFPSPYLVGCSAPHKDAISWGCHLVIFSKRHTVGCHLVPPLYCGEMISFYLIASHPNLISPNTHAPKRLSKMLISYFSYHRVSMLSMSTCVTRSTTMHPTSSTSTSTTPRPRLSPERSSHVRVASPS